MPTLFMIGLGGRPKGRLIEQHDMFFGVAEHLSELIPAINAHWPEVKNKWHIDAYRPVTAVDNYRIEWVEDATTDAESDLSDMKLYFINLGGYLAQDFEEYHHKLLIVAPSQAEAVKQAKQSEFYRKYSFNDKDTPFNAASHIDDKLLVDIDEIYNVNDLLSSGYLQITRHQDAPVEQDKLFIGYLSINKLKKLS
ncbi:DUF1543 domain-containing protein [Psychrobacter pygoscelis]|uniref:DUF1543 domain-containing protein n=1 Tax=Psychrobacter pygoscelis TaxID=2488563 RepID=UPI00103CCA51|nr:DUF1543 domain-containing protein [Psychrobacter pygoscelis]